VSHRADAQHPTGKPGIAELHGKIRAESRRADVGGVSAPDGPALPPRSTTMPLLHRGNLVSIEDATVFEIGWSLCARLVTGMHDRSRSTVTA
jgi:hypothetical protein